jgi:hypothetical protein
LAHPQQTQKQEKYRDVFLYLRGTHALRNDFVNGFFDELQDSSTE